MMKKENSQQRIRGASSISGSPTFLSRAALEKSGIILGKCPTFSSND
jgi:hypothetical protein